MSDEPQRGKTVCEDCEHQSNVRLHLIAENPFNSELTIHGCLACQSIDSFRTACDEPGCWDPVCCGTPSAVGYRNTCRKHQPNAKAREP